MSYPIQLDEYDNDTIFEEALRRRNCKSAHKCFYCGRRLDDREPCKLSEHNEPIPPLVAQESVMQMLAIRTTEMIPSGRGFVTIVSPTVEDEQPGTATYVSSIRAEDVPALLRGMADYIEKRERVRAQGE